MEAVLITACSFTGNQATSGGSGGAVYINGTVNMTTTIRSTLLTGNTAEVTGGAVYTRCVANSFTNRSVTAAIAAIIFVA